MNSRCNVFYMLSFSFSTCIYIDHHYMHKTSDYMFEESDTTLSDSNSQDWLGDMESQGAINAIHISNKRRTSSISYSKSTLQITGNFCGSLFTYICVNY